MREYVHLVVFILVKQNVTVNRWKEHLPRHKSEPAKHIQENHDHEFEWRMELYEYIIVF